MVKVINKVTKLQIVKAFNHYKRDRPHFTRFTIINRLIDKFGYLMQPQYSQGAAPSHHPPPYAPPEVSQASGGSITSSLRQWRKKDYLEKQQSTEQPQTPAAENSSHVARVAPHTYYPRLTNDVCHYQHQYTEYGAPYKPPAPAPVKYSEIVDNPQAQTIEHITPVVPKLKDKEFGELCSVPPQPHLKQYPDQMTMKQSYPDGTKQTYSDPAVHHQYISKESQIHPFLQKQSQMHQYMQKEPYQQFLPKYGMQGQYPQSYPSEPNNFLAHLNKINPRMAQSIMNDTHLRDPQIPIYHSIEQNRSYPQPQRMYHTPAIHSSPTHAHRNIPQSYNYAQPYNYNVKSSMQPNDPYNRVHQYQHNVPKYLPEYKMNAPIEQPIPNISPQHMYNESVRMNYAPMPPKISPNYPHCSSQLEYAQHYQHRRAHLAQEYYSHYNKSAFVQNPQVSPEGGVSDGRTRKSSLKQYLETWVEEDMSGNLPDLVVSSNNLNDVESMEGLKGTMCLKGSGSTQEQPLYVLDTTEIPNENLPHFLHLQQFEKLPDNIRGYYHSTTAVPPGGRRIIIENNSAEMLPESNQVIRGNSAPMVPKLSEGFAESGSVVESIVNQSEGQRKIIASEDVALSMGRGLQNQIQNLENKVVQIHIIEDSEATSSNLSSDIAATLNTHQKSASNPSDTVIIQSNVYPHSDPFAKLIESDESCVIKKRVAETEEESRSSNDCEAESKTQSDDEIKNMPVIDESLGEGAGSEITKDIFVPPKEAASSHNSVHEDHAEEDIPEDLQASETASSRRSSICSIYKEMEHIHGENNSAVLANSFESANTQKSNSESVSNGLDTETAVSTESVRESDGSINSAKTNSLEEISEEPPRFSANDKEHNEFEELNAKENHSNLETVVSHTPEDGTGMTDLTSFTNPEIPLCPPKDILELSETETAKTTQDTATSEQEASPIEHENHRNVSKKLRTAKLNIPSIAEDSASDETSATAPELLCASKGNETSENTNSATEFFQEANNNSNPENIIAEPFEESLLLHTKETNCIESDATDSTINTVLETPEGNKNCAINCQSSNTNLIPTKENLENEAKLAESSDEMDTLDEIDDPKNLPVSPSETVQITDSDKENTAQSPTSTDFETTCHQIDHDQKGTCSNTKESPDETAIEKSGEDIAIIEQPNSMDSVAQTKLIPNISESKTTDSCGESPVELYDRSESPIKAVEHPEENVACLTQVDYNEPFTDAETENCLKTPKPLNLSLDKKHANDEPTITDVHDNHIEISPVLCNEIESDCVLDDVDYPIETAILPESDKLLNPENLSYLVKNSRKRRAVSEIISAPSIAKTKSMSRKKESARKRNAIRLAKQKGGNAEKKSKREKIVLLENEKLQEDVPNTNLSSDITESENGPGKDLPKCAPLNIVADTEDNLKPSTYNATATPTEAKPSLIEAEIQKLSIKESVEEKTEMPELVAVSDSKSITELVETPSKIVEITSLAATNTESPISWSEMNDTEPNTESSEATMPILKCMVNYTDELESLDNMDPNLEDPLKFTDENYTFSNTTKRNDRSRFKNSSGKMKNRHARFEIVSPVKKQPTTSKKSKNKEKITQRELDQRRKSRRLNREPVIINTESSMPKLVKENISPFIESTAEVPPNICNTEKNVMETYNFEDADTIEEEIHLQCPTPEPNIVNIAESIEEQEPNICTDPIETKAPEEKAPENIDQSGSSNRDENIVEQSILTEEDTHCSSEESLDVPENKTKDDVSVTFPEEPEKDLLAENDPPVTPSEQTLGSQEEDFENNNTSIVYQINDTNVVLQIADELLEINVTTQNGKKIISVKTFSDAVIMNNSEETNCQTIEDPCVMECEASDSNIEIQDQKSEDVTPLNNNYIDGICSLKDPSVDVEEEAKLCFKEQICAATDITTVGDDVFIYNEEVVSSSTEIEAVSKLPKKEEKETETVADDVSLQRKYSTRRSTKRDKRVSWEDQKCDLDKTKCLSHDPRKKPQKDETPKPNVHPDPSEPDSKPSTNIKDSLRKSPKTKAALKFVEAVRTTKPKVKEPKVPSKPTSSLKTTPNIVTNSPAPSDKSTTKIPKKHLPVEQLKKQLPVEQLKKQLPVEQLKKQLPVEQLKKQLPVEQLKKQLPVEQLKKQLPVEQLKKQPPGEQLKKPLPIEQLKKQLSVEHGMIKDVKNVPKQKQHSQNKSESHSNGNKSKVHDVHLKPDEKTEQNQKIREKPKAAERVKQINASKTKRTLSPKEEKSHQNKSSKLLPTPKKKPKIEKASVELAKTITAKVPAETRKSQKQKLPSEEKTTKGTTKKESKDTIHPEITETPKAHKESKKPKSKPSEEQTKTRSKHKLEEKVTPVKIEEPLEENQISVQENSITSSTSQDTEALLKQRSNKLIQQITDDWDDDSDDMKAAENSCKRRLSLQEYNSRKRTSSLAEQETAQCELNKPDLTDNLFTSGSILIAKREISPESPILSVKFNNKTYSRGVYPLKPNMVDTEPNLNPKETNTSTILEYKHEEPLSSAIELHLPRINRSPRPAYNQEYLRNALMNDLQAVNAYTTTLIKENQQLMQRFLEQKRLTTEELKKVKTIIRYKRLVQHLSTIKINEMQTSTVRDSHMGRTDPDSILYPSSNPMVHLKLTPNFNIAENYDVNKRQSDVNQILTSKINPMGPEVKLNVEKRKKKRFRFLYSDDTEETEPPSAPALDPLSVASTEADLKRPRLDGPASTVDPKVMDYSVHQGNSQGQLTLVFKRSFKSDPKMQPFVKLERLPSIDLLAKNRLQ